MALVYYWLSFNSVWSIPNNTMKDTQISIKVNGEQLARIKELFGLTGTFGANSRAIQLSLNFTENVILNLFGGDLKAMFLRNPKDITKPKY